MTKYIDLKIKKYIDYITEKLKIKDKEKFKILFINTFYDILEDEKYDEEYDDNYLYIDEIFKMTTFTILNSFIQNYIDNNLNELKIKDREKYINIFSDKINKYINDELSMSIEDLCVLVSNEIIEDDVKEYIKKTISEYNIYDKNNFTKTFLEKFNVFFKEKNKVFRLSVILDITKNSIFDDRKNNFNKQLYNLMNLRDRSLNRYILSTDNNVKPSYYIDYERLKKYIEKIEEKKSILLKYFQIGLLNKI
jgi:hypothetical protein